jgi:aminoglycoside phosphotransferase (APT) family kinase protein
MSESGDTYEAIETPWRRSPEELGASLGEWVSRVLVPGAAVSNLSQPGNGMSSESMLFDATVDGVTEQFVARLAPQPQFIPVFETYDIDMQAKVMTLVGERTTVPVPVVAAVELDSSVLDVPFLVMRRLPGDAPSDVPPYVFDGPILAMSDAERAEMQLNAVRTLAELHTITVDNADLTFLERRKYGTDALDQHLGHERHYYEWAREGKTFPLIERTFAWLEDNRPTLTGPTVLNWGDARLGNMMFEGPRPTAVLDWEMASVGPAEVDLAWMIFLHAFFQNMAVTYGFPGLPDFMTRESIAAQYSELTGRPVEALEWFEVFAALRFATISTRTSLRSIMYGQMEQPADLDDLIMFRPLLEQMLDGTYWS